MSEPLPKCPLCGSAMAEARKARPGWLYCATYVRDLTCNMPVVTEVQLRALAALRKPLTEQEADALVERIQDRARKLDAGRNDEHPAYMASWNAWHAVLDEVRAALTGKRSPPA